MNSKMGLLLCIIIVQSNNGMFESAKFKSAQEFHPTFPHAQYVASLAEQSAKVLANQFIIAANEYENTEKNVFTESDLFNTPIKRFPVIFQITSFDDLLNRNTELLQEKRLNSLFKIITFTMLEQNITGSNIAGIRIFSHLFNAFPYSKLFNTWPCIKGNEMISIIEEKQ